MWERRTSSSVQCRRTLEQESALPHVPGGYCDLGPEQELRDATAVWHAFTAASLVVDLDNVGARARRQAREAVTHYWQYPRIPGCTWVGGYGSGYPEASLWTPQARAAWARLDRNRAGRAQKTQGIQLCHEHLIPQNGLCRHLLENITTWTPYDVMKTLTTHGQLGLIVVMTAEEDRALSRAGHRMTTPDLTQPWKRYAQIGVTQEDCAPIDLGMCRCQTPTSTGTVSGHS